jgi:parallel beta-helix repeat protein
MFGGSTVFANGVSESTFQDDIHPTIHISGNADLLQQAADNGWPGTGTADDPIVIQGYRFLSDMHIFTIAFTDLYVNFTNNWVEGMHHTWCSLVISLTRNVIICNNTIFGGSVGVHLISANDTLITRNTIHDSGLDAVFLDGACTENTITGNFFYDNDEAGVFGWGKCRKNTISDNLMQYGGSGVYFIEDVNENYIINNTIVDTMISGIDLVSKYNEVRGNQILSCNGDGIRVFKPENVITGNQIIGSRYRGVYLAPDANNTEVLYNSFVNNTQESVLIIDASRNILRYNDFLGESERAHASDSGYLNIFEMNYWDGFLAIDENRDGVFDSPYEIEGQAQNRDFYPVTTINNPLPTTPEKSTESTESTSTSTSSTSSTTNSTTVQDSLGYEYMLLVVIGVVIPILVVVSFYRRKL